MLLTLQSLPKSQGWKEDLTAEDLKGRDTHKTDSKRGLNKRLSLSTRLWQYFILLHSMCVSLIDRILKFSRGNHSSWVSCVFVCLSKRKIGKRHWLTESLDQQTDSRRRTQAKKEDQSHSRRRRTLQQVRCSTKFCKFWEKQGFPVVLPWKSADEGKSLFKFWCTWDTGFWNWLQTLSSKQNRQQKNLSSA